MKPKRVISLLPAATEMVCVLGVAEQLVGRSHECDYPPEVRALPACTKVRSLPMNRDGMRSGEIDRQVRELVEKGESLYQLEREKMRELQPDLIITQAQCEACAVSLREVEEMVSGWSGNRPQIISLSPSRLAEIWEDIRGVSQALEIEERGREVLRALKNRVVNIIEKACVLTKKPTMACIEWLDPLMAAGNWVPELVELAGGKDVLGEAGKHSAWMDWEALRRADPDFIVLMPCGFDIAQTRAEMPVLTRHPGWAKLNAVKKKHVYIVDGNQYFNRPGPRIVESLEILAEMMHPDRFKFGHKGWEKAE